MDNFKVTFYEEPSLNTPLIWIISRNGAESIKIINYYSGNIRKPNDSFIGYNILLGGGEYFGENPINLTYSLEFILGVGYGSMVERFYLLDNCSLDLTTTSFTYATYPPLLVSFHSYPKLDYEDVYDKGFSFGYNKGLNEGTSAWGVIFNAFMGVFDILSIEIFPGFTLGAIAFIPLILGVISFIFNLGLNATSSSDKKEKDKKGGKK